MKKSTSRSKAGTEKGTKTRASLGTQLVSLVRKAVSQSSAGKAAEAVGSLGLANKLKAKTAGAAVAKDAARKPAALSKNSRAASGATAGTKATKKVAPVTAQAPAPASVSTNAQATSPKRADKAGIAEKKKRIAVLSVATAREPMTTVTPKIITMTNISTRRPAPMALELPST